MTRFEKGVLAFIIAMLLATVFLLTAAANNENRLRNECTARGGVPVKTGQGETLCIAKELLR